MTRKMKDSGVEWIGEIPEEWGITKMQCLGDYKKGPFGSAITLNMFVEKSENAIKVYEQKNAINKDAKLGHYYITEDDFEKLKGFEVFEGDIIVSCAGTIGKCFIMPSGMERGIINQALMKISLNTNINKMYFLYLFDVVLDKIADKYSNGSAIKNIPPFSILKKYKIPFPKLNEQSKISEYIDNKCTKIDQTIEKEKEVIEKLKEYKQSAITEAVTKGLNPDVKMKNSGVEWIGEIPEHWLCKKLKGITNQIIDGTHSTPNYQEDGIPFLRVTDITTDDGVNQDINWDKTAYINEGEHNELIKRCNPQKGDLLVSKNGTIGVPKIVDWNREFSIFVSLCLIKVKEEISVEFLYYYFKSSLIWTEIAIGGKTGTITNLHLDKIREFKIPLPNKDEQQQIVNYLDKKCSAIDKLISSKEKLIEKLTEYKKSLIYECVTGKREVQ